jgi:phosphatidylserine/phosphatidylglycerophosphate/cardiolipin synthase-like enzyme
VARSRGGAALGCAVASLCPGVLGDRLDLGRDSTDKLFMRLPLALNSNPPATGASRATSGDAELVSGPAHFHRVVRDGILRAKVSIDIMTADFKAMLVPQAGVSGRARSIVEIFRSLASRGVEIRLLHAGVPSSAALRELKRKLPRGLVIRRCPRLHAKAVVIDSKMMYLGSANLTGAGLGAKGDDKRNFELGVWTCSPSLIDAALEQFNHLWEGRPCARCRRKDICPVPLEEPTL